MEIIPPIAITDANLVSSSVPEADRPAYSAGTTYAVGDEVMLLATHRIYRSLTASNVGRDPTTDLLAWLAIAPTNRWGMFDRKVGTKTTAAGSIVVVLAPGKCNRIALFGLVASTLRVRMTALGVPVFDQTINLIAPISSASMYAYFFEDVESRDRLVVDGIPVYAEGIITVTLTGTGNVSCGVLVAGMAASLGCTEYGADAGIDDYSRKERDEFGNLDVVERPFSDHASYTLELRNNAADGFKKILTRYRATPVVWVGGLYEVLMVYGFYKSWSVSIKGPVYSIGSLEVEGLSDE